MEASPMRRRSLAALSVLLAIPISARCLQALRLPISWRRQKRLRLTNERGTPMRRSLSSLLVLLLLLTSAFGLASSSAELVDAVEPYVAHLKLKREHLRALADGQVLARGLASDNDKEMAAVGVVMADASPEAFVESYKTLATFQQNPYIIESGRFGDNPTLSD